MSLAGDYLVSVSTLGSLEQNDYHTELWTESRLVIIVLIQFLAENRRSTLFVL